MKQVAFSTPVADDYAAAVTVVDVPEPAAASGQVLVRTEAIGVSVALVRALARFAADPAAGMQTGGEFIGTVVAVGDGVERFAVGDRVGGVAMAGVYAELVACEPVFLSEVPADIDAADALALVRGGLIALSVVNQGYEHGDSVLVTAAASGIGHLAVQLAGVFGASRVVAVLGREPEGATAKADLVRACGADEVYFYDDASWGEPVDLVLDAAGGDVVQRSVDALAARGRVIAFSAGGGSVDAGTLLGGLKTVTGFSIGLISRTDPGAIAATRAELWKLHAAGRLKPATVVFPLASAAAAVGLVAARANSGRVVLTVN